MSGCHGNPSSSLSQSIVVSDQETRPGESLQLFPREIYLSIAIKTVERVPTVSHQTKALSDDWWRFTYTQSLRPPLRSHSCHWPLTQVDPGVKHKKKQKSCEEDESLCQDKREKATTAGTIKHLVSNHNIKLLCLKPRCSSACLPSPEPASEIQWPSNVWQVTCQSELRGSWFLPVWKVSKILQQHFSVLWTRTQHVVLRCVVCTFSLYLLLRRVRLLYSCYITRTKEMLVRLMGNSKLSLACLILPTMQRYDL